jgi:polyisoprenoid-binding protein YceI
MSVRSTVLMLAALLPLAASAQFPSVKSARPDAAPAAGQTFIYNDDIHRDTVTFMLEGPLEVINGLSNQVKGTVAVKNGKAEGKFSVPVSSLKTGNETRDGHLQNDRWLDAAKNPDILFEFKDLALPAPLENGKPVKVQTMGKFTIHGVTREEPVEVTAIYFKESAETKNRAPGDLLRLRAKFRIPIEAYGIKRTEALILKVGENADVSVDAWGSTQFKL